MAVLRTVFLAFLVYVTVQAMPWSLELARTEAENYARVAAAVSGLQRAAWYAVGWIGFDAVVGWWLALRGRGRKAAAASPPAAAPPNAPPTRP